ncbi:hypothetical protein XbrCFBP1976_20570 [Xanthomonas bromi]|uniref:Integrase catalytic domain-containing protein n=1 Tax=Xanthomonas bromi TaxID=56449 RepID=A0ABX5BJM7_9XANT|nr:hypothetical protein XbrCFBP1976_20570 [Xanthomonas bromi]
MVESFNSRLRQKCLNEHWFSSLTDAQSKSKRGCASIATQA